MPFSVRPFRRFPVQCILDPIVKNIPENMMEHRRYKYVVRLMAGLVLASTLSGCSIGMALSGHKDPNMQSPACWLDQGRGGTANWVSLKSHTRPAMERGLTFTSTKSIMNPVQLGLVCI